MLALRFIAALFLVFSSTFIAAEAKSRRAAPVPEGAVPRIVGDLDYTFPNSQAVLRSVFVPDLDDGFVPQGLAADGSDFILSGYVDDEKRARCRTYRLDRNFKVKVRYDVMFKCNHAGGVAVGPTGTIYLADTKQLLVWMPGPNGLTPSGPTSVIRFRDGIRGTFLSSSDKGLVIGSFYPERNATVAQTIPWKRLTDDRLKADDFKTEIDLLPRSQGMAYLPDGRIVSSSQSNPNMLSIWTSKGKLLRSYPIVRGTQAIVPLGGSKIATVSESGSKPLLNRKDKYPAIMIIDVDLLESE